MSTPYISQPFTTLRAGGVVKSQQIDGLVREIRQKTFARQRNQSLLELERGQSGGTIRNGSDSLDDCRGRQEVGDEAGKCRVGKGVEGRELGESVLSPGVESGWEEAGCHSGVEGLRRVDGEKVGQETGGMGGSHGSAGEGARSRGATDVGREDVET